MSTTPQAEQPAPDSSQAPLDEAAGQDTQDTAATSAGPEAAEDADAQGAVADRSQLDEQAGSAQPAEGAEAAEGADAAEGAEPAEDADAQEADADEAAAGEGTGTPRTEQLVREGEIAADFLEGLLDIADLAGDLEVDIEGDRAAVAIVDSEDGVAPRRLVGPGGQVLDALQELTRLAVQAETGERSRLMLDVAGHRSDRRSALVTAARSAIADVKESGERRELEPMTAFERKVVHDEVLAAGLRSESEGAEPSRYVVILPTS